MELPKYYELYKPFLKALSDEKVHTLKEIKDYITKLLNLNEEFLWKGCQVVSKQFMIIELVGQEPI